MLHLDALQQLSFDRRQQLRYEADAERLVSLALHQGTHIRLWSS
jgi:hypothetical protein